MNLPTVMLWPEETPTGVVYLPGNRLAETLADLMGVHVIKPHKLPLIEKLGFQVAMHNGQPIKLPPGAYKPIREAKPQRVRDEA